MTQLNSVATTSLGPEVGRWDIISAVLCSLPLMEVSILSVDPDKNVDTITLETPI